MKSVSQFIAILLVVLATTLLTGTVLGQQPDAPPVVDNQTERLNTRLANIDQQQALLDAIAAQSGSDDQALSAALRRRLNQERIDLMGQQLAFARAVAAAREQTAVFEEFSGTARALLDDNLQIANQAWTQMENAISYPDASLDAVAQSTANRAFFNSLQTLDRMNALSADSLDLMVELDYDTEAARGTFLERLQDRAVQLSVYLDLAQEQVVDKRASAGTLPDDANLTAQLNLAVNRVTAIAASMQNVLGELDALGEDTTGFREQLVVTTGAITTDVLDTRLLGELVTRWSEQGLDYVINEGPDLLIGVIVFLIVLLIAFKLSRIARRMMERGLKRSRLKLSELLKRMIISTAGNLVLFLGVLFALAQIGISLGPLLAGLGIAGFIIGFALQDSLSNFASGMMILFYRPYDVGDVVELNGMAGKVEQMSLVNTTIHTFDNQRIIMPNAMIWGGIIKNVTAQKIRRVDMVFGISYTDDIDTAQQILSDIVTGHKLVLREPEAVIRMHELADSSVNFIVRPWTNTEDYWNVYWDIMRDVKLRFDKEGISIPFPQRDVHVIPAPAQLTDGTAQDAGEKPAQPAQGKTGKSRKKGGRNNRNRNSSARKGAREEMENLPEQTEFPETGETPESVDAPTK